MAAAILMALRLDLKDYLMDKKLKNLNFSIYHFKL